MLEDVDYSTLYRLTKPKQDKDGKYIKKLDIPEEEREGKYFNSFDEETYLPESYIQRYYQLKEDAIGRKLLKKTIRKALASAARKGVKNIEYPAGTVVTEDVIKNLTNPNKDYLTVYNVATYPDGISDEEVEKTIRKALKHSQMDDAIRKAFEQQKNILKGIDGNFEDDDDD